MLDDGQANRLAIPLRWIARVSGTILFALVLGVLVGNVLNGTTVKRLPMMNSTGWLMVAALAAMLVGCVVAWRWEIAGGLTILIAGLIFIGVSSLVTRSIHIGAIDGALLGVGALFVHRVPLVKPDCVLAATRRASRHEPRRAAR